MWRFAVWLVSFAVYQQGLAQEPAAVTRLPHIDPAVRPAQFAPPPLPYPQTVPPPASQSTTAAPNRPTFRKIQFFPRSAGGGWNLETVTSPTGENVAIITGGVNLVIQNLTVEGVPEAFGPLGDIDIETDRAVIWGVPALANLGAATQPGDLPLEIYLEGNIVFRQGDRIMYADRMFYDVRQRRGIILGAELLTPVPQTEDFSYAGLVRLRAAALRQLDQSRFVAQDGLITTSRIEEPSYHFAAETIMFEDIQRSLPDPVTGAPAVDQTGQPVVQHQMLAQSQNNFLYVAGVPVFYWPTLATDLRKPSYYIDNFRLRNDSVFGTQVLLEIDAFQVLGIERLDGVEWDLNLDWLSERGLGFGTGAEYARDSFFNLAGPTTGRADAWFIDDRGVDNLGLGRRAVPLEEDFRGRVFWNHRQHLIGGLLDDWTVQAEVGWISDRNFLEQYYEQEWEENKDQISGARLKRTYDNQSISVEANGRLNEFFTQTQWLPRLDHYLLGEPLFDEQLTWFAHSTAAYANIGIADPATNTPNWTLLPWEIDSASSRISAAGERFTTRHEIDYPISLGPVKVVPFALGELAHWGEDIEGDNLQRAYVHTGLWASIPFWMVDPSIREPLFNLNGLAHKVVFEMEASYADATRDLTQLPLYDELEDDVHEEMRRRLFFPPFGSGLLPTYYLLGPPPTIDLKFDPRFYALRSGLQGWVSSPSAEIADDLAAVRFGMRHRLQTKRGGAPGASTVLGTGTAQQRIIDWLTLDANATWFPDANRDNAGAEFGLIDYDFRWHLGDRFSILSDGYADTFGDGLRTAAIGMLLNRPARGNFYLGFRSLGGVIEANVVNLAVNYRMSPKWIGSAGASFDVSGSANNTQSISFARIGESLIATVGGHHNESQDNFGISFLVEPRFLPNLSVTRRTGIEIPPVGAYGLE